METMVEKIGDVAILTPAGERLEASNAKEFKGNTEPFLVPNSKVVFDMSHVRFVDSTGLGTMVSFLKRLKAEGGDLKLYGLSPSVRKLFELVRVDKIIDIYDTKDETLSAFQEIGISA